MSVYVDNARLAYGRMKMCHMVADTDDELHRMAAAIGMKRAWFQKGSHPHYDVCRERRAKALALGAIPVSRRELVEVMRRYRRRRDLGAKS